MPNFTDFSVLMADGGFTGMNTAFIDGAAAYHSPQDVPERLDRGTLQALGRQRAGDGPRARGRRPGAAGRARRRRRDVLPGAGRAGPLPRGAGVAAGGRRAGRRRAAGLVLRRRGDELAGPDGRRGTLLAALPLVLAPLAAQGLWALLVAVRPGYGQLLDPGGPGWFRLATVALVAAVVLCWYALLRRRMGPRGAGGRRAGLAGGARGGAGRRRARRLLPGGVAGAGRGAGRARRGRSTSARVVRGRRRAARRARSPSSSWRRPCRCSSRRWA